MEAGSLSRLVEIALSRAWRRSSPLHGEEHWRCVAATGLALASAHREADRVLAFCFGLLHDTRRWNDSLDPDHGRRAARFAGELRDEGALTLDDTRFRMLDEALRRHADGATSDDPTIGTCWDADRLHLPRVHIQPDPRLLSTAAAARPEALPAAAALRASGPPAWAELAVVAGSGR